MLCWWWREAHRVSRDRFGPARCRLSLPRLAQASAHPTVFLQQEGTQPSGAHLSSGCRTPPRCLLEALLPARLFALMLAALERAYTRVDISGMTTVALERPCAVRFARPNQSGPCTLAVGGAG